jgi:hypothetical protein
LPPKFSGAGLSAHFHLGNGARTKPATAGLFSRDTRRGVEGITGGHIPHLTLSRHELDHEQLLLDIMIIADEVDWQLTQAMVTQAMASLTEPNLAKPAA